MDKEKAKAELKVLLERYNSLKLEKETDVKSKEEEKTKIKLIRPLFEKVLGWNFEEDVTAEEKISKGWVDYGFRINEAAKFFLEAKSLKENLDNSNYFRQAVSYAYYKGCPWAILTNFETIKILNAEWEAPMYLNSHFMTINCYDFLARFDDLWLLSKEGFEQGILDKLAERFGKRTKKSPLTHQLTEDFTRLRTLLSKNITKENLGRKLTEDELDESVQKILNRLIFIRNCEDRGFEEKKLWEARNEARVWKHVKEAFQHYDTNYDSKLFTYDLSNPKNVHLSDTLSIDDLVMREVIDGLYHTQDKSVSYDFSLIPADVLGAVYEQYLGHILKKTKQRASISENHVHRKKQGIYYTPTFVVEYIVKNSLGELLQKKVDIEKVRVLDPTCGSGSFLIKAFDVLDGYYSESELHQTKFDLKDETLFNRKVMVLKNNIFGVDLDKQAVEIAQLNLLLKIAGKAKRLPVLEQNIRCGNSLIDSTEIAGDKAFNWRQNFGKILNQGGFDIIIGNPPYVHQKGQKDNPTISFAQREYFRKNYESLSNKERKTRGGVKLNLFIPYVERCIKLLKENGRMGFIVHKNLLKVESYKFLRQFILKNCAIERIVDLGAGIFKDVTGETIIVIFRKEPNKKKREENQVSIVYGLTSEVDLFSKTFPINKVKQRWFDSSVDNMFTIYLSPETVHLKNKMEEDATKLEDAVNIVSFGLNTSNNKKYFVESKVNKNYKKAVMGRDLEKWVIKNKHKFVLYDPEVLTRTGDVQAFMSKEKLIMQRIGAGLIAAYDDEQYYCYNSTNMILPKDDKFNLKYILALINSDLLNAYYRLIFGTKARLTVNVTQGYLSQLPIKSASSQKNSEVVNITDELLSLKLKEAELKDKETDEKAKLKEKITTFELALNNIVYEIYGINNEEKKIIEKSLQ